MTKEQLPAQLQAELLLFGFARKQFQPLFFFFFLHPVFPPSVSYKRHKRNAGFLKKKFYTSLLDSLLRVVNGSSKVRGNSLKQSCNLQLFLY